MSADGDTCPRCGEEFVNCECKKGDSPHTTYDEDGEVELYDGWYDPGK